MSKAKQLSDKARGDPDLVLDLIDEEYLEKLRYVPDGIKAKFMVWHHFDDGSSIRVNGEGSVETRASQEQYILSLETFVKGQAYNMGETDAENLNAIIETIKQDSLKCQK